MSGSTVSRVLARAGLSQLRDLQPAEPVLRYEREAPGELLHIDIKKLGRIRLFITRSESPWDQAGTSPGFDGLL